MEKDNSVPSEATTSICAFVFKLRRKKKCRSYPKRLISGCRHKDMSSASVWWTWIQATSPDEVLQKATYSGKANSLILASANEIFFFLTQNFISLQSSFYRWDPHYRICKNFRIFSIGPTLLHSTTKYLFIRVAQCSLRINNLCLFWCLLHRALFHEWQIDFILHAHSKWRFELCIKKGYLKSNDPYVW